MKIVRAAGDIIGIVLAVDIVYVLVTRTIVEMNGPWAAGVLVWAALFLSYTCGVGLFKTFARQSEPKP